MDRSQQPGAAPNSVPVNFYNNASAQPQAQPQPQMQQQPQVQPPRPSGQQPVNNGGYGQKDSKLSKKVVAILVAAAVVVTLLFAGWNWNNSRAAVSLINDDRYQAVFLTNGQVYFGKLQQANSEFFKLTDIYYLQVDGALQAADGDKKEGGEGAQSNSTPQLIKLGQEVHGPEDEMIIGANQVLFFENLTDEGTVAKSIKEYVGKKKEQ